MALISYHASHEQFSPSELLIYVQLAEQAGFGACHSSDHFHPWSKRQGHSGFAMAWLGAAMAKTRFPFSFITAPGQRYHPAIVAQGIATLLEMFPNRLEVALGSGEALNESITWDHWPNKQERNQRLLECAQIIKDLLQGHKVNFSGMVQVHEAQLYTLPPIPPALMCAALSEETAHWAGSWAEGLLTIHHPRAEAQKMIDAFRQGGGHGKPLHVQIAFSYGRDKTTALIHAHEQWRNNILDPQELANINTVEDFDKKGQSVSMEQVAKKIIVDSDPETFRSLIREQIDLGFENIILHNVNKDQVQFIQDFGEKVLPFI